MRQIGSETRLLSSPRVLLTLAVAASILLAILPLVGLVTYPIRLLMTIVHELSHGLAALATGGRFLSFVVFPNGSGLAYTAGGWSLVIIPAGYLGTALFGAALLLLDRGVRSARVTLQVIGGAIALLTALYGTPTIFSPRAFFGLLTVVAGVGIGLGCVLLARRARPGWVHFLLYFLAVQAGLTAFSDLMTLIGLSTVLFIPPVSDAQAMAGATGIPAVFWAVLWALITVVLLGWAVRRTWSAQPSIEPPAPSSWR